MGIEVKPAIKSGELYEFKYKGILMFVIVDTDDNELFLCAPVFLTGDTDECNRNTYEIAKYTTREELKNYIVELVSGALSYVGQIYVRPKHIRKMRRYQLLKMLDEIVEIRNTFLFATMMASVSKEECMKDIFEKQED